MAWEDDCLCIQAVQWQVFSPQKVSKSLANQTENCWSLPMIKLIPASCFWGQTLGHDTLQEEQWRLAVFTGQTTKRRRGLLDLLGSRANFQSQRHPFFSWPALACVMYTVRALTFRYKHVQLLQLKWSSLDQHAPPVLQSASLAQTLPLNTACHETVAMASTGAGRCDFFWLPILWGKFVAVEDSPE